MSSRNLLQTTHITTVIHHDDVIKWKHFPRYCPFVRGIHWSPVNSPHKGQWHGALMFSLICVWINGWVNNREAGDLRRYPAHHDVSVMILFSLQSHIKHLAYYSNGYSVTRDQVRATIRRAMLCRYHLRTNCVGVSFHTDGHWVDYNGHVVNWQDTAGTFCQYASKYRTREFLICGKFLQERTSWLLHCSP